MLYVMYANHVPHHHHSTHTNIRTDGTCARSCGVIKWRWRDCMHRSRSLNSAKQKKTYCQTHRARGSAGEFRHVPLMVGSVLWQILSFSVSIYASSEFHRVRSVCARHSILKRISLWWSSRNAQTEIGSRAAANVLCTLGVLFCTEITLRHEFEGVSEIIHEPCLGDNRRLQFACDPFWNFLQTKRICVFLNLSKKM